MKPIATGATGPIGTEVIRPALRNKAITSLVTLTRNGVHIPEDIEPDVNTSRLQPVIVEEWLDTYPDLVNEHIKDADACIWALAVTSTKSQGMDFAEVTIICNDYTINGLYNITAHANSPFRFIHVSGVAVERDQIKQLSFLADDRLMRGRTENAILNFAKQHAPSVQATIAKPGGIENPGHPKSAALTGLFSQFSDIPWVHVSEIAAAMIDQCVHGITNDPLWGKDLQGIASRILCNEDYVATPSVEV